MSKNIYLLEGGQELIQEIEELWQKLNIHHMEGTQHFKEKFKEFTFEYRKKKLIDKAAEGEIKVLLAIDRDTERKIGYCVSTFNPEGTGEIESIFIDKEYRRLHIGDMLMEASLKWLESKTPKEIILTVAGGNEGVLDFYKKYGFYTTSVKLARMEESKTGSLESCKDFVISSDKAMLRIDDIFAMLQKSYWAAERSRERIVKSIENSMCFGVYHGSRQVGFARIITDYVVNAYLCDVIIDEEYRGNGLGKELMSFIMNSPELQEVKNWTLATNDAHKLYEKYGFGSLKKPENFMIKSIQGRF
ncbi:MAG: GCN5-related N-acetyltransferase [Clostridia bacterium]|nr:GCN5-related N-acetyltransferase [Clostridia bacterium]